METVRQIEFAARALEVEERSARIKGERSDGFAEIMAGIAGSGSDSRGARRDRGQVCQENDGKSTQGCQSDGAGADPDRDPGAPASEIARDLAGDRGFERGGDGSERDRERHRNNLALPVVAPGPTAIEDDVRGFPARSGGLGERDLGELVRRLHQSVLAGREKVRFSSRLEQAIEVRFDVRIEGKRVFVTANVPDARTGALLTMSLEELRERLAGCGLELAGFDVAMDDKSRRSQRNDSDKDGASPGAPKKGPVRARLDEDHALNVIA